ncbi:hypothetical protein OAF63_07550 [Saprospiraceae bacterium]|nr:hypothetical protein [Saprospiraceae bacterium]
MTDNCFIPFIDTNAASLIPDQFNDPFNSETPAICKIATAELQDYLMKNQQKWKHNFGLNKDKTGPIKGKMFGVLVVKNTHNEIGYLCTFSGKMADEPHPLLFVPSLFDISTNDNFITKGMSELKKIGNQIKILKTEHNSTTQSEIRQLKNDRKAKSIHLQQELFDQYHFLNKAGKSKSLCAIFEEDLNKKPPSGAGECAAPKLLQYAYERKMKPLAIAEFWWGKSTKSEERKHKVFYPACQDKCQPILGYMLNS